MQPPPASLLGSHGGLVHLPCTIHRFVSFYPQSTESTHPILAKKAPGGDTGFDGGGGNGTITVLEPCRHRPGKVADAFPAESLCFVILSGSWAGGGAVPAAED